MADLLNLMANRNIAMKYIGKLLTAFREVLKRIFYCDTTNNLTVLQVF